MIQITIINIQMTNSIKKCLFILERNDKIEYMTDEIQFLQKRWYHYEIT